MQIKPLGNRVLVKPIKEEQIKGGIVLPDTAEKQRKEQGEVVAVGTGEDIVKLGLKPGDKVLFGKYSGEELEVEGEDFRFLNHEDVLAIMG